MCYTLTICSERGCGHILPIPTPCIDRSEYDPHCSKGRGSYRIWQEEHYCHECFAMELDLRLLFLKDQQDRGEALQTTKEVARRAQAKAEKNAAAAAAATAISIRTSEPKDEPSITRQPANVGLPVTGSARRIRNDKIKVRRGRRSSSLEQLLAYEAVHSAADNREDERQDVSKQPKRQVETQATVTPPPAGWYQLTSWLAFWD